MTSFRVKTIESRAPLGERLRHAREKRRLSLDVLACRLSIGTAHLLALEEGAYRRLPGEVYGRNFVRVYAGALGIPLAPCVNDYTREYRLAMLQGTRPSRSPHPSFFAWFSLQSPLRLSFIFLFLLGFGYLSFIFWETFTPPFLTVFEPSDRATVSNPTVVVRGEVEKEARVTINGENVQRSDDGRFEETIDLHEGVNTIAVTAEKKHGRRRTIERQVFFREGTAAERSMSAFRL